MPAPHVLAQLHPRPPGAGRCFAPSPRAFVDESAVLLSTKAQLGDGAVGTSWGRRSGGPAGVGQLAGLTLLMLKSGTRSIGIAARVNQSFHSRGRVRSVRLT